MCTNINIIVYNDFLFFYSEWNDAIIEKCFMKDFLTID